MERDFAEGVFRLITRTLFPPYTLYNFIQYTYSHREEGEVGELN
jgi:hypothetical protein